MENSVVCVSDHDPYRLQAKGRLVGVGKTAVEFDKDTGIIRDLTDVELENWKKS